jgi:hypothetical protein
MNNELAADLQHPFANDSRAMNSPRKQTVDAIFRAGNRAKCPSQGAEQVSQKLIGCFHGFPG